MISEEALEKFKAIHKKHFHKELSNQDAFDSATKLLRMVEIVYQPMTEEDYKKVQKRREETK